MSQRYPTILLVDGLSIVRHIYEAVPGDDSDARAESAITSSWQSIQRALRENCPTHFLAAFDHESPTWRHKLFDEYKDDREPMPEALRARLPWFLQKLNHSGLRAVQSPGFEADDIIGTLTLRAIERKFKVIIATTDKDLCALIREGVLVREHFKATNRDEIWVRDRFGVEPRQIPDYLALVGDQVDGIPGVPGIGEKTAPKLLAAYGDLETVLAAAAAGEIKGHQGAQLVQGADSARLSLKLATLSTDVDLEGLTPRDIALPPEFIYEPESATHSRPAAPPSASRERRTPAPRR